MKGINLPNRFEYLSKTTELWALILEGFQMSFV